MGDRKCIVCQARDLADDEPQTCRRCAGRTLSALLDVARLHTLLDSEIRGRIGAAKVGGAGDAENPIPMSELLSLLGPGAAVSCRDAQPDDAPSVVGTLAGWEDDWRHVRGLPGAPRLASVQSCAEFLAAQHPWAANRHSAFDEYAHEMRQLRWRLLRALGLSDDPVRMNADCFECGDQLVRDYQPRSQCQHGPDRHGPGCDQGGLRDWCRCVGCGRTYTPAQYHLALRATIETVLPGQNHTAVVQCARGAAVRPESAPEAPVGRGLIPSRARAS